MKMPQKTDGSEEIKENILNVFGEEQLKQLARECNFVQRSNSKTNLPDFIKLLTTAIIGNSYESLAA